MTSDVVVGLNSFNTLAEAKTYLGDSIRATSWQFLPSETQKKALISATRTFEKLVWQGTKASLQVANTVAVAAGGTGHVLKDVLTVSGGTGVSVRVEVTGLSGTAVSAVKFLDLGLYSVTPTSPAATTSSGAGTGCTLNLTFQTQLLQWARTGVVDKYGQAVDPLTVPTGIKNGQMEYAYELTLDPSLEISSGTGSNVKRAKGGPAEVEFFRPMEGDRFSSVIQELIGEFLASSVPLPLGLASGSDEESSFDDDSFGLNQGFQ